MAEQGMKRRLSGVRATGRLHLGNYLGALSQWVDGQHSSDNFFFIADLHGLTAISSTHSPGDFRDARLNTAASFLAAGIDPHVSTLFLQSAVPQHTELMWYMLAISRKAELERMTQWKDKKGKGAGASSALFAYPTLMAADILLYDADEVPVGDDQRQHVEVARDWAQRFNSYLGETFVLPSAVIPADGARVMDLLNPRTKMSKSNAGDEGVIYLDDSAEDISRKIKRAQTDSENRVLVDEERPGVSNLVTILCALTGADENSVSDEYSDRGYGIFKAAVADAVVEALRPVREKSLLLRQDPAELRRLLGLGTDRATTVAEATCARAAEALGLGRVM